ncbi:MAG TPA: PIN domain-containing protein [Anaerolineales bacterium]|nr:PIN domain-containing protein [Anaerolineales bacterium]
MSIPRLVLDTSVFVAALRSRRGASFKLLSQIDAGVYQTAVSVPLVFEYEAVGKRHARAAGLTHDDIDDVIDFICQVSIQQGIFYLWRPFLKDPGDDLVLELAVAAECDAIVTHNVRDFAGAEEQFQVAVWTPQQALRAIGGTPK